MRHTSPKSTIINLYKSTEKADTLSETQRNTHETGNRKMTYANTTTPELHELVSELADMLQHARSEIDVDTVEHELQLVSEELALRPMTEDSDEEFSQADFYADLYDSQCAGR